MHFAMCVSTVGIGQKFTMGPNGQNQHFGELRQKVCLYIHSVVLL